MARLCCVQILLYFEQKLFSLPLKMTSNMIIRKIPPALNNFQHTTRRFYRFVNYAIKNVAHYPI
jgi:hypothetical protein